jgi:hypothetical protein
MNRTTLLLSLLLLVASVSSATQIVYKSPRDLGREASLVVDGQVTGVRSYWNAAHTAIFTETMVAVGSTYKGQRAGMVRVVQPGGTVGHVRTTVAGALAWQVGEEVVLFLEPGVDDAYQVAGFSQGKFNIQREPGSNRVFVQAPDLSGVELVNGPADAAAPPAQIKKMSVETFINQALGRTEGGSSNE